MEQTAENQKKPVGRKIGSIILLCVASLLVLAMVLCYVIPKNFAPKISTPDYIKVHTSSLDGTVYNKGSEQYNKIWSYYNDSLKVTIMDALLTGNIAESGEYVEKHSNPKTSSSNYIELCFSDGEQTISDGAYQGSYKTYISMVVSVENTKELTKADVYFMTSTSTSWVRYQTYAHQASLYDYMQSL